MSQKIYLQQNSLLRVAPQLLRRGEGSWFTRQIPLSVLRLYRPKFMVGREELDQWRGHDSLFVDPRALGIWLALVAVDHCPFMSSGATHYIA